MALTLRLDWHLLALLLPALAFFTFVLVDGGI